MKKQLIKKELYECCQALKGMGFELTEIQEEFNTKYEKKLAKAEKRRTKECLKEQAKVKHMKVEEKEDIDAENWGE